MEIRLLLQVLSGLLAILAAVWVSRQVGNPSGWLGRRVVRTYRGGPFRLLYGIVMPLLGAAFLSDAEHRDLLTHAGFTEVATIHQRGTNWICARGRRP
ncbi:MAG TPA: hypothetical protein VMH28_18600 [Candidatus Acidoferrales bacterium]|nr:hypothetical protein [Candidatus Acidoferrales bacterium]